MEQMFKRDNKWVSFENAVKYDKRKNEDAQIEESTIKVEEPLANEVTEEIPNDGKPVFICAFCGRECKSQWHLDKHLQSHKNEQPSEVIVEPEVETPVETEELKDFGFETKPISEEPKYELNEELDKILE